MATTKTTKTPATKTPAKPKEAATFRPEELAKEIGVSGKQIRAWLRKTYPRQIEEFRTSWVLSEKMAQAVRDHFLREDDEDED